MPWTIKDVDSHKKGLTNAQKKRWVETANGILKSCIKDGGTDKTCAPKAIRIANSKFSLKGNVMMETVKIPKGALRFFDSDNNVFAKADDGEDKPKKLEMTMLSGGIIKDHFFWGDLAIDIEGGRFPKKFPILEEHSDNKKIAFSNGPPVIVDGKLKVNSDKVKFVSTDASEEFQKLSCEGFPYQASIFGKPIKVETLEDDTATAEVNGFTMKGPGAIWREWELKEASVAVFGWDEKTESSAFSKTITEDVDYEELNKELTFNRTEEVKSMDLVELKKDHPDVVDQFKKEIVDEITKGIQDDYDAKLKTETDKFSADKTTLETRVEKVEETNLELSKENDLRADREMANSADRIWDQKLAGSDVAEKRFAKVKQHVSYKKHLKDDGSLDTEAFSTAIDTEIKDWEDSGVTNEILGTGSTSREVETSEKKKAEQMSKESKAISDRMLNSVGQKQKEEDD